MKLYQVKRIIEQLHREKSGLVENYKQELFKKSIPSGGPPTVKCTVKITAKYNYTDGRWDYKVNGEDVPEYRNVRDMTLELREALKIPRISRSSKEVLEYETKLNLFINDVETRLILSDKPALDELNDLIKNLRGIK